LSNLHLPWKTGLPWNFLLYWNIFYYSGFLSNLRLPLKQSLPWNLSSLGGARPPASYAYAFRYFRHHFGSTFPRNPTKPMFHCFPTPPLMRWRFQHTCRWIWQFQGCLRHSPTGKKPNNWLQEAWWYIRLSQSVFGGISVYRKAFLIFWRWMFKEKTEEIWSWLFFTTWISWIWNFIIKFNNAFTSTLAIFAALDSNLVVNLELRKYTPSSICSCTSAACNSRLSWWAV